MATTIDPRVIAELALILEGINPFPHPNEFNFDTCRGFKKDSTSRCGNSPGTAEERKKLTALLSEFRVLKKCVDTGSLYDKMESLITLTHCKRRHREDACEAFDKWKAQRKTVASDSPPVTPRSAIPHADSLESLSDARGITLPRSVPDSPGYEDPTSDSYITEKMKSLKICTTAHDTQTKTDCRCFDEAEAQTQRFKRLGDVRLPEKGKEQDDVEIYKTIRDPPSATSMCGGILYVREHTKISNLCKIGWTRTSADQRLKQPRNCYKLETKIIHQTEGGTFIGAFQAERIAHAILAHKRILISGCTQCKKKHREWFLVSGEEACSVVKLAERWLKIPAYSLQQGNYKLTPKGVGILKIMLPFSINDMNVLIDKTGKPDNNLGASSDTTPRAADRETSAFNVSSTAAEKEIPRVFVDTSYVMTQSLGYTLRGISPMGRTSSQGATHLAETEEMFERYEIRSRETTPEGNYIIVTEQENIIRKKVSRTNLDYDRVPNKSEGNKQEVKEVVEVREICRVSSGISR
ncbi:uncharacterized protein TRIVIDRAFT_69430 [Trichoderma virens Gv29-8]|uniref:Bacteriophage T5 Orf172 DNA-binding domain-containing protein n=1 Tax=Hypocrea virens (strain Gv29-8 / FGSC 10586) TaxID=413071 RepID=G9MXX2_HYPVG|nr:uncharacterized protein TRIVIDRAFT_69430 [Trichoderma virens Gv29-8]EHK20733.1 hypothetical protein TRIVIDRAFT_69430 [Trichoderma virens Gv29-8]